jgi:uncharacterized protein (DUF305 family)
MSTTLSHRAATGRFASTLSLFLGTGFISGAIVHSAGVFAWYEFFLFCIGILLFTLGAYQQIRQGLITTVLPLPKFLGMTALLSVGIGILSGGIQHFLDTPQFATWMIALGLPIGGIMYLAREQLSLSRAQWTKVIVGYVAAGAALGILLLPVANFIAPSHGHTVASEQEFLRAMVPHHREAVTSSADILTRSENKAITDFARTVIEVQSFEIATMQSWHKTWFNEELTSARYRPMMPNLSSIERGPAAEQAYLRGMIAHHEAAVTMAKSVKDLQPRPELLGLADGIIATQQDEIGQLQALLKTNIDKNGDVAAEGSSHSH